MPQTDILGISAFYHDSAACLLRDGEILAAAQEERFTRQKGDASFPAHAVEYCLQAGGISTADLAFVGFYDKPLLKFERILDTYLGVAPRGFVSFLKAAPVWLKLERVRSLVTAWLSADGLAWTQMASTTVALGSEVYAGVVVTSHDPSVLNRSTHR